MTPNATRNGTNGAMPPDSWVWIDSQDSEPTTEPRGSLALTAAMSELMAAPEPALRNRYSICRPAGAPSACRLAISAGVTQPAAELVTESAMPTTVSTAFPRRPVTTIWLPGDINTPLPGYGSLAITSWPGPSAQWQFWRVRSSIGPPAGARPTSSIGGFGCPAFSDWISASPNGPSN